MKIYIGLIFFGLLCNFVQSTEDQGHTESDYQNDDTDEDYIENEGASSPTISNEAPPDSNDIIVETESFTHHPLIGSSITLKCKFAEESDLVWIWYNGTRIIFQGTKDKENTLVQDERLIFDKKDGSLTIKNVSYFDKGNYRCRVYDKSVKETQINLQIVGPPEGIFIYESKNELVDVSNTVLKFNEHHKSLHFKCNVSNSRPSAKISWIHNGNTLSNLEKRKDHNLKIESSNTLILSDIRSKHAGQYFCEASNEHGIAKAGFKIEVSHKPIFVAHDKYINVQEDQDAEIVCKYRSNPPATKILWLKGGSQIHENEKYSIKDDMKDHLDRTKLTIKNVNRNDDLTVYVCEVQNELGKISENITLGLGPAPAKLIDYTYINEIVHIDWIISSHQKITEIIILYRNKKNGLLLKSAKITNQKLIEGTHDWKIQGTIEGLEHGRWEIQTRSKNTESWSDDKFMNVHVLKIPKDSQEDTMDSSAMSLKLSMFGLVAVLISSFYFA